MRLILITKGPPERHRKGLFRCICGTIKTINLDNARPGKTESCGCLKKEQMSRCGKTYSYRHGGTGTVEYSAFMQAKSRCNDKSRADYMNYGGRGIKFLYKSFKEFIADVGRKLNPSLSLDRVDNNGNYESGNCRWATAKEQRNNQRA